MQTFCMTINLSSNANLALQPSTMLPLNLSCRVHAICLMPAISQWTIHVEQFLFVASLLAVQPEIQFLAEVNRPLLIESIELESQHLACRTIHKS